MLTDPTFPISPDGPSWSACATRVARRARPRRGTPQTTVLRCDWHWLRVPRRVDGRAIRRSALPRMNGVLGGEQQLLPCRTCMLLSIT